jgi:hypothetical protein
MMYAHACRWCGLALGLAWAPGLAQVQVGLDGRPDPAGEALGQILALAPEPLERVAQVLGADWIIPFSAACPFVDMETGERFAPGRVVTFSGSWPGGPALVEPPPLEAGYGLPVQLRWAPWPAATSALLSYREGSEVVRREVTGQDSATLILRGRPRQVQVEAMRPSGEGWDSHRQHLRVSLRGLAPHAGNPLVEPGHLDGPGVSARFRAPAGLALVPAQRDPDRDPECLVTDAEDHVLRTIDAAGRVRTLCGQPGVAGHRDTDPSWLRRLAHRAWDRVFPGSDAGGSTLFHRPTFVVTRLAWTGSGASWQAMVSDSGNHVLRHVNPQGEVKTIAGSPGVAGYRDADSPAQALFNTPQGLAVEPFELLLYVADQGNAVVRTVEAQGPVRTLAGKAGERGDQDGAAAEARFTHLKGVAVDRRWSAGRTTLYVLDGHALRAVDAGTGRVTTVLGTVATPAFQTIQGGDVQARRLALLTPCLNDPWDLQPSPRGFLITDRGNHAIREWRVADHSLVTVAGAPTQQGTRPGLLRDGLPGPLDERYAALDRPAGITGPYGGLPEGPSFVVTGASVAFLGCGPSGAAPPVLALERLEGGPGGSFTTRFSVAAAVPTAIHYTVEFLEPDGTRAELRTGEGCTGEPLLAEGCFAQQGEGTVLMRCVTAAGLSAELRQPVTLP